MSQSYNFKVGYPGELFVKTPFVGFNCTICLNVLNQAQQCYQGHLCCKPCFEMAFQKKIECPTCRIAMQPHAMCDNLLARDLIDLMEIKCMNEECEWRGQLPSKLFHDQKCEYRQVVCSAYRAKWSNCIVPNCNGFVNARNISAHKSIVVDITMDDEDPPELNKMKTRQGKNEKVFKSKTGKPGKK